jgi:hypothetical protein
MYKHKWIDFIEKQMKFIISLIYEIMHYIPESYHFHLNKTIQIGNPPNHPRNEDIRNKRLASPIS